MLVRSAALALCLLACAGCASTPPPAPPQPTAAALPQDAASFMAAIATRPGVTVTPSGLAYRVVHAGPPSAPTARLGDQVRVDYEGALTNGEVFDASDRDGGAAVFTVGQLVPGWNEALQMMRPGDEWMLYVPPALGYGDEDKGPIPANSAMIFRLKLLAVLPSPTQP